MKKLLLFLGFGSLLIFVLIQFVPIEIHSVKAESDFEIQAPQEVKNILKAACYDCHSDYYNQPWYGHIAPVSWFIYHHVEEGRDELNFSKWGKYTPSKQRNQLEDIFSEVEEGEMPMFSYKIMHPEARLSDEQRKLLMEWTDQAYENISD